MSFWNVLPKMKWWFLKTQWSHSLRLFANRANRELGPYQPQEAEFSLQSVNPNFAVHIPEQANFLRAAKSRTESLQ